MVQAPAAPEAWHSSFPTDGLPGKTLSTEERDDKYHLECIRLRLIHLPPVLLPNNPRPGLRRQSRPLPVAGTDEGNFSERVHAAVHPALGDPYACKPLTRSISVDEVQRNVRTIDRSGDVTVQPTPVSLVMEANRPGDLGRNLLHRKLPANTGDECGFSTAPPPPETRKRLKVVGAQAAGPDEQQCQQMPTPQLPLSSP